jgi:hypothetical protein
MLQGTRRIPPPDVRNRQFINFVLESTNTKTTSEARHVLNQYINDAAQSGSTILHMEATMGRMEARLDGMVKDFECSQRSYAFVTGRYGDILQKKKLLQYKYDICEETHAKRAHALVEARERVTLYERLYIAEQKVTDLLQIRIELLKKRVEENTQADDALRCAICLGSRANTVLLPCRHANFCRSCVAGLYATQEQNRCPICRATIESFVPFNM